MATIITSMSKHKSKDIKRFTVRMDRKVWDEFCRLTKEDLGEAHFSRFSDNDLVFLAVKLLHKKGVDE